VMNSSRRRLLRLTIVGKVAEDIVEEDQMGLEEIQGTSEAGASEAVPKFAAPESTSEADNSVKVTQISETLITISPSSSQPPAPEPTQDNSILDNLVSHYSSELTEANLNLQRASEVAS
jgi:hypothetical protein